MTTKPCIYVFVNGGRGTDWVSVLALSEDGYIIAGHICSHEGFIPGDMGLDSDRKHDLYREKYPDGFELKYLDGLEVKTDEGFRRAADLCKARNEKAKAIRAAAGEAAQ